VVVVTALKLLAYIAIFAVLVVAVFLAAYRLSLLAFARGKTPSPQPHKLEPRGEMDGEGDFVFCLDTGTAEPIKPGEQHHDVIGALGDESFREMERSVPRSQAER
jgi:hypothetical protein